jgi:hypothetical protein
MWRSRKPLDAFGVPWVQIPPSPPEKIVNNIHGEMLELAEQARLEIV